MSDPMPAKAKGVLERLSADPEVQRLAQEREEAFLLYQMELNTAREEAEGKRGDAEKLVLAADAATLDTWAERILSAKTLSEVIGE